MLVDLRRVQRFFSRFPFSVFLAGLSVAYGIAIKCRRSAFERGILKQGQLPGFVLSVGNITTGGTGKTPATMMLAEWARNVGFSVCVLSKGYGGNYRGEVLEVSDGARLKATWEECGDEPYLMARTLNKVPVVVARKRYIGGLYAAEKFGSNFFLLDDGFQHLRLWRDFDLVLLRSDKPFDNGHLLPWGILREPVSSIKRAHAIIVVGKSFGQAQWVRRDELMGLRVFKGEHIADSVIFENSGQRHSPSFLKDSKIIAFAGIGRPKAFEDSLRELGARVIRLKCFPDHHVYTRREIEGLERMLDETGAEYLITTEKDWVKVANFVKKNQRTGFLRVGFKISSSSPEFFGAIREAALKRLDREIVGD